jgi:hypothetical protein
VVEVEKVEDVEEATKVLGGGSGRGGEDGGGEVGLGERGDGKRSGG